MRLESLDRSVIAAPASEGGVLVQWRLRATDAANARFDVFKNGVKVARTVPAEATDWRDANGDAQARYTVQLAGDGDQAPALNLNDGYLTIPLDRPAGGVTPDGVTYEYEANDGTVGDLDGDGRYEIVLKWQPTNAKDNAFAGFTGPTLVDAYTLDGRRLWRIDLGRNIRSGAHYTQMIVQDFDGDGRAEIALKTADGTVDGTGRILGDGQADWRETGGEITSHDRTGAERKADGTLAAGLTGRILTGPEFITVFDGRTGAALASAPYVPSRGRSGDTASADELAAIWGDGYGNRSERYLGGAAYLDGRLPSIVMARGYYGRTVVAAWDWRDGRLSQRWVFDSDRAPEGYAGQGNHQFSVADIDGDGRQEIVYGAMALDDDGTPLWTTRAGPRRRHACQRSGPDAAGAGEVRRPRERRRQRRRRLGHGGHPHRRNPVAHAWPARRRARRGPRHRSPLSGRRGLGVEQQRPLCRRRPGHLSHPPATDEFRHLVGRRRPA
nr:hypothetical protein [Brevundimonas sp. SORGH_AS_0993]